MARKKEQAEEPGTPMDQAPGKTKKTKKAKFEGGQLVGTIWHKGKTYGPGQEEAFSKAGASAEALQMLADKGQLTGFGTKEPEYEEEDAEE